ncbi:hypothetical protein RI054_05g29590 [Pseudoscourfieldia marina]
MQPHGKQYIYLGFKDAHSAYVYDPVTSIHPRTSPSLRRTRHEFRQHHLGRRHHTASARRAVEGGGGDGLDEVDKFIHDALNQAPPTEGGASPIEGGGEPDLGALGIHGHTKMVNDRVYKRITRIMATTPTKLTTVRMEPTNALHAAPIDTPFAESIDRLNNYDSIFANPPFPSVTELHRTSEIVRPYSTQTRHSALPL